MITKKKKLQVKNSNTNCFKVNFTKIDNIYKLIFKI